MANVEQFNNNEVISAHKIDGVDLLRFFEEKAKDITDKVEAGFKFDKTDKAKNLTSKQFIRHKNSDRRIYINFIEKMDVKNVIKEDRCYIHLENNNGSFVDIPYKEYRKRVINEEEHDYMEDIINRLFGVIDKEENDGFTDLVCEYIAKHSTNIYNYIKEFKEIGWDVYYGKNIFKYDRIYPCDLEEVFDSKCSHEEEKAFQSAEVTWGLINEFNTVGTDYRIEENDIELVLQYQLKELLSNVMKSTIENRIIISAAFTGVFRNWLNDKDNNININIYGDSASGKTTITRYALSLFGNPEELEGSFSDGEEAVEVLRANRVFLPYVVDDRLLRSIDKSEQAQAKEMLLSIFREYDSRVKERAGGKNAQYSGRRIYGPILSSSVNSIFEKISNLNNLRDLGQYRRLIELHFTRDEAFSIENWNQQEWITKQDFLDDIKTATNSAYGHTFKFFIQNLTKRFVEPYKLEEDAKNKYNVNRSIVRHIIGQIDDSSANDYISSVDRFALILTSYDYLFEFLYEFERKDDQEEELAYDKAKIITLLITNLIEKMNTKDVDTGNVIKANVSNNNNVVVPKTIQVIESEKYLEKILKFFETYKEYFKGKGEKRIKKEEIYENLGWYRYLSDDTVELIFRKNMNAEFVMIHAEHILGRKSYEEEIKKYIECNAKGADADTLGKNVKDFVIKNLGIKEKAYEDNTRNIKKNMLEVIDLDYNPSSDKNIQDGQATSVFKITNLKKHLSSFDSNNTETKETGEA